MFKKFILVLVTAAVLLALTSCITGGKDGDKTVIRLMYMEGGGVSFMPDWLVLKEIEEKTGVKLNVQVVPGSDYNQKRAVVFASGDLPDIMVNTWPGDVSQFAMEGILLPVSDHLDKLPTLKKTIKEWGLEKTITNICEADGKFYIVPAFTKDLNDIQVFAIREDILNELGLPLPETYDELYNVMVEMKKKYPETLGTGELHKGQRIMSFMAGSFGTYGGFSLPWGYSYKADKDEWYFAPTSDEYFALLSYLNKLYKAGCLDPEAFTQDQTMYSQKVDTGKYFVIPSSGPDDAERLTLKLRDNGFANAKVTALYPLAGPTGLRTVKPTSRAQGGLVMPAKIADRKDFDKIMEFCDWLYYSEEAAIMSKIGLEGVTYDIKDGKYVMKPEVMTPLNREDPNAIVDMSKKYGFNQWGLRTLVKDNVPDEVSVMNAFPEQLEFEKYIRDNGMAIEDDPTVKFTPEQSERTKLLISTLNDYCNQMRMKFIFGQESFDNWDNYVQEAKRKGSDELVEIVTKAWKENTPKGFKVD